MSISWRWACLVLLTLACAQPHEEQAPVYPIAPPPEYEDAAARVAHRQAADDSVVAIGMSAGGAIGAWIAQWRADVHRAVLIAPALGAGLLSEDGGRELVDIASMLPNITRTTRPDTTRPDMVQGTTSRGLSEVLSLGHRVRDQAVDRPPRVRDVVFLLNERDHTVSEKAALDLAQQWFDHGAVVVVYKFPASAKLPHNVMERTGRGGNTELVYPIVTALARGMTPPPPVQLQSVPCRGFRCTIKGLWRGR